MPSSLLQETCGALAEMRNVGFTIAVQTYTPKRFTCLLLCDESVLAQISTTDESVVEICASTLATKAYAGVKAKRQGLGEGIG